MESTRGRVRTNRVTIRKMNETLDDVRLRAAEAQMRHALGLDGQPQPPRPDEQPPSPGPAHDRLSLHRPPRRFVKDGEVPVTVVRRTHPVEGVASIAPAQSNQLEAARQTIRSQAAATERAERALTDAQTAVRDLRTKLAHERMAKEEAYQTVRRLEAERDAALSSVQTLRMELATERVGREKLEQELHKAVEARQAAETAQEMPHRPRGRPRKVVAPVDPLAPPRKRGRPRKIIPLSTEPPPPPRKRGRPRKVPVVEQAALDLPGADGAVGALVGVGVPVGGTPANGADAVSARRGRPRKVREPKPVKWWVKGWKPAVGPRI